MKHGFSMNEFTDYCFHSSWDGDGEVFNGDNKIVWLFHTTGLNSPTVFAFRDKDGKDLATIKRERRFPLARFAVIQDNSPSGAIWQRTIWFTKYEFRFDKSEWNLHMPMFSVSGRVTNRQGATILISARTRRLWFVRIDTGLDIPPMMAALTFVIRKKLQCT